MKLRTKLTLWFTLLLLLAAAAMLAVLYTIAGRAAQNTAKSTLESAVTSYAGEIEYSHGELLDFRARNYDNGAYLLVFSADGSQLIEGADIFGVAGQMPAFVTENEACSVFHTTLGETGVYCYIQWLPETLGARAHNGGGKGAAASGETAVSAEGSDETASEDGVWIIGVLPEDSMENAMTSLLHIAAFGLPVIVLLAALGGWVIAGRSLRPLETITASAREITDGHDLSRRIGLAPGKDEVHELADTFNDMMGRLERSFEAEQQFTSDASHELRTPTAVILAECELAEKSPEDAQGSLQEIHRQARKMSDLIGRLLSYTRLEQGTRQIEHESVDLSELADDICDEQRMTVQRDISIECEAEPEITVNGDASLLIILIQNLISNAVKYGQDGGHVWVRVFAEKQNACVSVRDDGIGISTEDLDRIWNRFYQADRSRSDESRGVGLGLSLAQQIARLHGGSITASSTLGEGSDFIFAMPKA